MEITLKLSGGATMTISHVVDYFVSSKDDYEKLQRIKHHVNGCLAWIETPPKEDNDVIQLFEKINKIVNE